MTRGQDAYLTPLYKRNNLEACTPPTAGCGDAGLQRGFLRGRDEVWDRRCSSVPCLVPLVISKERDPDAMLLQYLVP
jgi:hypothetical protein